MFPGKFFHYPFHPYYIIKQHLNSYLPGWGCEKDLSHKYITPAILLRQEVLSLCCPQFLASARDACVWPFVQNVRRAFSDLRPPWRWPLFDRSLSLKRNRIHGLILGRSTISIKVNNGWLGHQMTPWPRNPMSKPLYIHTAQKLRILCSMNILLRKYYFSEGGFILS